MTKYEVQIRCCNSEEFTTILTYERYMRLMFIARRHAIEIARELVEADKYRWADAESARVVKTKTNGSCSIIYCVKRRRQLI